MNEIIYSILNSSKSTVSHKFIAARCYKGDSLKIIKIKSLRLRNGDNDEFVNYETTRTQQAGIEMFFSEIELPVLSH